MNEEFVMNVLKNLKDDKIEIDKAFELLRDLPYFSIEHLKFDLHRKIRRGVPEVVFAQGKTFDTLFKIIEKMNERKENLIITRLNPEFGYQLNKKFINSEYDEVSKVYFLKNKRVINKGRGKILILSAGNSDLPVAKEALLCAKYLGNDVELISDIGIAGIHRISDFKDKIHSSVCIIVVAGMEGALPSYIASICNKPVIGVPTSIGYGANLGGLTALFGMLCNCSGGVAVVNIDNGFGAAYFATLINRDDKK
jgi:NCAIR mutase (PurE)-related protein